MTFPKNALISALIALSFSPLTFAQDLTKPPAAVTKSSSGAFTDEQLTSLMDQLIKSGKLDGAVDAGIKRFVAEQEAKALRKPNELSMLARKVTPDRDHIYGNLKAEWSLIVYSDLECPYCKQHAGVPEAVAKAIGLDKVNVVFRQFPLPMHGEAAKKEAVASECVAKQGGNDGFFKFVNAVLHGSRLNGQGLPGGDTELLALAKDAGVKNETLFISCLQDPKIAENVKDDLADGAAAGVSGTPGNILRNNRTGKSFASHGADRGGATALEAKVRILMATK